MKHVIISTQFCKICNRDVKVIDAILGREAISAGCERIFHCCPYCHTEIEDTVVPLKEE